MCQKSNFVYAGFSVCDKRAKLQQKQRKGCRDYTVVRVIILHTGRAKICPVELLAGFVSALIMKIISNLVVKYYCEL